MEKPSPLGFGLGLRPVYYQDILEKSPRVDWFEVISENFMVDGGQPRQLTHFTDRTVANFAWSRDGARLAVARATVTNDIVLFKGLK